MSAHLTDKTIALPTPYGEARRIHAPIIPEEEVPEGWTTDPELLNRSVDGVGWYWANRCGLENPVALMRTTPEFGDVECLFTAGGRYYFMEDSGRSIFEIIKLKTLDGILQMMRDGREKSIPFGELKQVEPVETEEERNEGGKKRKELWAEEEKLTARLEAGFWDWKPHEPDRLMGSEAEAKPQNDETRETNKLEKSPEGV